MIRQRTRARAVRSADLAIVRPSRLTAVEAATALGIEHALRTSDFAVADAHTLDRASARLVFTTIERFDEDTARAPTDAPLIVWPMVRQQGDVEAWARRLPAARSTWTASRTLAARLRAAGVVAHDVGLSCQFGAVRHGARRSRGVREEDRVFTVFVDQRIGSDAIEQVRRAWTVRRQDPRTRYEKETLLVSVDGETLDAWRTWAARDDVGSVVVERRGASALGLTLLLEIADCEILLGEATRGGLVPSWTAAGMLFRGKPVLAVGDVGSQPFGPPSPPHLHAVPAGDAAALASAMQPTIDSDPAFRERCEAGARQMLSSCSARATAVRATTALREAGLWDSLVRAASS